MLAIDQEQLFKNIEILPMDIKTKIVDMLLKSFNNVDNSIDSLWIEEAKKRRDEIESGQVTTVSGDEVFRKIQERFQK